ncbi:MAG: hypothetical protein ACQR33_02200 [Candidatus Saccharibacteria bacterium]
MSHASVPSVDTITANGACLGKAYTNELMPAVYSLRDLATDGTLVIDGHKFPYNVIINMIFDGQMKCHGQLQQPAQAVTSTTDTDLSNKKLGNLVSVDGRLYSRNEIATTAFTYQHQVSESREADIVIYDIRSLATNGLLTINGHEFALDAFAAAAQEELNSHGRFNHSAQAVTSTTDTDLSNEDLGEYVSIGDILHLRTDLIELADSLYGMMHENDESPQDSDETDPENYRTSRFARCLSAIKRVPSYIKAVLPQLTSFTMNDLILLGMSVLVLGAVTTTIVVGEVAAQIFALLKINFVIDGRVFVHATPISLGFTVALAIAITGIAYGFQWIQNHLQYISQSNKVRLIIVCGSIIVYNALAIVVTTLATTGISHYLHH